VGLPWLALFGADVHRNASTVECRLAPGTPFFDDVANHAFDGVEIVRDDVFVINVDSEPLLKEGDQFESAGRINHVSKEGITVS